MHDPIRSTPVELRQRESPPFWLMIGLNSAFVGVVGGILSGSLVVGVIVVAYTVSLTRFYIGRRIRLESLVARNRPIDDYTAAQRDEQRGWRQRAARYLQGVLVVPFAPAFAIWVFSRGHFSAKVPREFSLTVAMSRGFLSGQFAERWLILLAWLCIMGATWHAFDDARHIVAVIVWSCYATMCAAILGYAVAPHSVAEVLKVSAARWPFVHYWLAVPVIAITMWCAAFLVSVVAGSRSVDWPGAVESLSTFVQYKGLIQFGDFLSSRVITEPSVLVELVPAACLFLFVVPGVFRFRQFKRSDVDRLRQAQMAVKAVRPCVALSALESVGEIGRSDAQTELTTAALVQLGNVKEAATEAERHTWFNELENLGLGGGSVALSFAAEYPGTEEGFRSSVRQWLESSPAPLEILYVLLEQKETSFTFMRVICQEVSRPERKSDDESLAAVNWQINVARRSGLGRHFDGGGARSVGWLPETAPLSVQLVGDMAHVVASQNEGPARLQHWESRLLNWSERFRAVTNGLDALLGLRMGGFTLQVCPHRPRRALYESLIRVTERVVANEVQLPPPYRPEHFDGAEDELAKHLADEA